MSDPHPSRACIRLRFMLARSPIISVVLKPSLPNAKASRHPEGWCRSMTLSLLLVELVPPTTVSETYPISDVTAFSLLPQS